MVGTIDRRILVSYRIDPDVARRFVPRRDTSSRLAPVLGGRAFPGTMAHGRFDVDAGGDGVHVRYRSDDGVVGIEVRARHAEALPGSALFETADEASEFFRRDSVGFSPARGGGTCQGVELQTAAWNVRPLDIECVHSSWFDDEVRFPRASIELDSALLMRDMPARWVAHDPTSSPRESTCEPA
jgi:hypothetical protein